MPNLRIVTKNALRSASSFTASSTAGALVVSNLIAAVKSTLHRFTGTRGSYRATWAAPTRIGCVALPFCNLSPTATMRVRVSTESSAINLALRSQELDNTTVWSRAAIQGVTANATMAPDGTMTADRVIPNNVLGSHYLDSSITGLSDNTIYSGSVFFKRDTLWRATLNLTAKNGSGSTAEVNFEDGRLTRFSLGTGGQTGTARIESVGGGWYHLCLENWNTLSGATIPRLRIFPSQHNEMSTNGWSKTNVTSARASGATSPYATWPTDNLIETTANAGHYATATLYTDPGRTVVVEQTMKALGSGATRYGVMLLAAGSGLAANRSAVVDLATGAITAQTAGTECVFSVESAGDGYWRLKCEFTPNLTGSVSWQIRLTNTSSSSAVNYTGDGVSGMLICKPYAYTLAPADNWAPFAGGAEGSVVGDGTTGIFAWGAWLEAGPKVSSYYPSGAAAGVRPAGYMDAWQSYDYDSGWVLACPAPAVELEGFTPAQAASAYAYGGGTSICHWLPQMNAVGLTVDIDDPSNLQGYIEAACMLAGPYWSPKFNADYGATLGWQDTAKHFRTGGGDLLTQRGTRSRTLRFSLSAMPASDRADFMDLTRDSIGSPWLVAVLPEDSDARLARDYTLLCKRSRASELEFRYANAFTTSIEFEEI